MGDQGNLHKGHRSRMRERFSSHGSRSMHTHELLEMLLYEVVPYKDTNPITKQLIAKFGGIDGVFLASREELMTVDGVGEAIADMLIAAGKLMDSGIGRSDGICYVDYRSVAELVTADLCNSDGYRVVIYLFDNRMCLIHKEELYKLDYGSGAVKGEAFIQLALGYRASVAITAHAHPHGPLFPLSGDIETNRLVTDGLSAAGVVHAEHFIVSGKRYVGIAEHTKTEAFHSTELKRFLESREALCRE